MLKSTLSVALLALLLSTSSGCYCLRNWLHCGNVGQCGCGSCGCGCGDSSCGGCGQQDDCDSCAGPVTRERCGGGCGGGCGSGLFDDLFGWGCGQVYWGDLAAVPPQRCQPCDQYGNWVGGAPTYHKGTRSYHGAPESYGPEMPMEYDGEVMEYEMSKAPAKHAPTPAKSASRAPRRAY